MTIFPTHLHCEFETELFRSFPLHPIPLVAWENRTQLQRGVQELMDEESNFTLREWQMFVRNCGFWERSSL